MGEMWVFLGDRAAHPSAVFSTRERAEAWIAGHRLSGTLTLYPVDEPIYEWAVARGAFRPSRPDQREAGFIQRFSSAALEHHHYETGVIAG